MSGDRRPSPPPLEANDQLVAAVLTAAWAAALIVMFWLRGMIPPGQRWWLWTCLTGFGLGVFGLWYIPRMKRGRARAAARAAARNQQAQPPANGSKSVSSTDTPGRSTRS